MIQAALNISPELPARNGRDPSTDTVASLVGGNHTGWAAASSIANTTSAEIIAIEYPY
jgi:hypothetical protein